MKVIGPTSFNKMAERFGLRTRAGDGESTITVIFSALFELVEQFQNIEARLNRLAVSVGGGVSYVFTDLEEAFYCGQSAARDLLLIVPCGTFFDNFYEYDDPFHQVRWVVRGKDLAATKTAKKPENQHHALALEGFNSVWFPASQGGKNSGN